MRVAVIGTGYVGLPLGACFAEMGNQVTCVDVDEKKVQDLTNGIIEMYEPKLEELVKRNVDHKRLTFTSQIENAIDNNDLIFVCVGTPSDKDGSADLKYVLQVAKDIGKYMKEHKIIIGKSTMPVGSSSLIQETIQATLDERGEKLSFDVAFSPEFMKEGTAVDDMLRPDRVVIGTDDDKVALILKELFHPFCINHSPIIITDIYSAEMIKYASNCFLATKITFVNEMADICKKVGADIDQVRRGMGTDSRISDKFLYSGLGFGGSCFPKDVRALYSTSKREGVESDILREVLAVNEIRPREFINGLLAKGDAVNKVAIWGLSFKPETDDIREAPALKVIDALLEADMEVNVYDPMAVENVKGLYGDKLHYFDDQYDCLQGVDALVLCTEWRQFRVPDFIRIGELMNHKCIYDGRNQYDPDKMQEYGFEYISIGRKDIKF